MSLLCSALEEASYDLVLMRSEFLLISAGLLTSWDLSGGFCMGETPSESWTEGLVIVILFYFLLSLAIFGSNLNSKEFVAHSSKPFRISTMLNLRPEMHYGRLWPCFNLRTEDTEDGNCNSKNQES